MEVSAVKCLRCGDIVYSRSRHDFRWCSCESVAIDGGQGNSYCKVTGQPDQFEMTKINVDATLEQLLEDYAKSKDKLGLIRGYTLIGEVLDKALQ